MQSLNQYIRSTALPTLTKADTEKLDLPFTLEELQSVINSLAGGKSPGPDGYTAAFYKTLLNEVSPSLLDTFNATSPSNPFPPSFLHAHITIIPKEGKDPQLCPSYRPISLINTDTKIYAKMIACRLAKLLENLVHPDQQKAITYLGIQIPSDLKSIYALNYDTFLQKTKRELTNWASKQISWTIPLALPKLFFRKLVSIINKFLWSACSPRIARTTLILRKLQGGLGLPDCKSYYLASSYARILDWFHELINYQTSTMDIISTSDDAETQKFYLQLCHYPPHVLRMTYEYFQEDLLQIMENLSLPSLLHELSSRNIPGLEKYKDLQHDRKNLAQDLLQEIFRRGREAVITLWVSLHVLRKDHGSPVLAAVLEELGHRGEDLPGEILLDEEGQNLPPALREIQNHHKKHLYEKTEKLIENKPPRCNQEEESFPFCTRYVTLIIVSTHHFRERSENELIATGARHEEYVKEKHHELQRISPNKMFRWCHWSRLVPHMVLVSGVPGVGKTTLMQKIVYDWVKGDLYQRFSFVFFFKFRELNQWDKVSLETLILHHYPYLWQQLGNILQDPEKLLFIFDGLDESNQTMDFTSRHLCSDPKEPERCGHIVVSLVGKSLLNGCSVLMTSRPTRLASMDCRDFQRMVEISGFFTEERKIYFDNFFRDPELAEKAFTYVRQNDTLYTFCYLPSYCWIICTVLSRSFQTTSSDQQVSLLPRTVTQLFAIFVANILSNHSPEKSGAQKLLQSMGWMAEHGVMNHLIIFDGRDLESFQVDNKSKLLSSFLMESEEPVSYSFLHLTVQEFFSAFVHYADYSPKKLQKSLEKAKSYPDGRGEMFLRFLCGLSDATTRSLLTGYLDTPAAQASRDVITWLRNFITGGGRRLNYKERLLRTFFYLFETRNKVLVQELLQSHRTLDLSGVSLSALDCTVLSFIMECCSHIQGLYLSRCITQDRIRYTDQQYHTG
ncbi:NACHT, LRR and PYD domains-containing protein 3-like [Engystomops pustulosus]|uniref:NACHT, LRR and PYD domains-containing protein 3-like n=1 Tax=Engystomops pustulosus TaxID=76066 RepID=UPI003AFAAF62